MDVRRFSDLNDIYGGRIARWPEAERKAAYALVENDAGAAARLADSRALDALLDDWNIEPAQSALREAVLMSASVAPLAGSRLTPWARDIRLWFAGAGLAAGLAGVFCGAVLSTVAVGEARDEALVASAVSDTAATVPNAAPT